MTNKEKQIEEMTKALQHDLILFSKNKYDTDVELAYDFARSIAITLQRIGYRKESEVVKDVLMEVLNIYLGQDCMLFRCNIKDLAEKYGVKLGVEE